MTAYTPAQRKLIRLSARDELCIRSFRHFAFYAWPYVEPGRRLVWNWHLNLLCNEIQVFTRPIWDPTCGDPEERQMVICVPPRSLKSYLTAVCLQSWLWLRSPWVLMQSISNDEDLSSRDSLRTMELITSPWYQRLVTTVALQRTGKVPDKLPWGISPKQAKKVNFLNSMAGGRIALGVGSTITGKGADLQAIDDPYDAKRATRGAPDVVRRRMAEVISDYDHVWKSRLNDPNRSLRMVIMQRLDVNDLAGELIKRRNHGKPIRVVVLPMTFDPDFPEEFGGIHPGDIRKRKGQLLMPQRWNQEWMDETGSDEGASRHVLAQYEQRPRPADGSLFKEVMFGRRFKDNPQTIRCDKTIIFGDLTFKQKADSDFVVLQVWGQIGKARFVMLDQVRARMGFVKTVDALQRLREKYPRTTRVVLEDKANGPAVVDALKHEIPGIQEWNPGTASKYERAEVGSAPPLEAGQVEYPIEEHAPWLKGYVERHIAFDGQGSTPDDEVDTTSMALLYMAGKTEHPLERLRRRDPMA